MTCLVANCVEEMAKGQGIKRMKFFNRKRQEMVLQPNDLLKGVGENVITNIIKGSRNIRTNLPVTEDSGRLLDGPEVSLDMDEEITDKEIADLLEDKKKQREQAQEKVNESDGEASISASSILED